MIRRHRRAGKGASRLSRFGRGGHVAQRHAVHEVHDEVAIVEIRLHLVDADHVRVPDAPGDPRLVEEHVHELLLGAKIVVNSLDRDQAAQKLPCPVSSAR